MALRTAGVENAKVLPLLLEALGTRRAWRLLLPAAMTSPRIVDALEPTGPAESAR